MLRHRLHGTGDAMTDIRKEKPWVKTYCGGKPNYCTPEVTPDVDAVNTSQEPVDEPEKLEHEEKNT